MSEEEISRPTQEASEEKATEDRGNTPSFSEHIDIPIDLDDDDSSIGFDRRDVALLALETGVVQKYIRPFVDNRSYISRAEKIEYDEREGGNNDEMSILGEIIDALGAPSSLPGSFYDHYAYASEVDVMRNLGDRKIWEEVALFRDFPFEDITRMIRAGTLGEVISEVYGKTREEAEELVNLTERLVILAGGDEDDMRYLIENDLFVEELGEQQEIPRLTEEEYKEAVREAENNLIVEVINRDHDDLIDDIAGRDLTDDEIAEKLAELN